MVFIVRAGRSQSRQQLRCSTVPPPCKQVSHRSPSQSAPGCPPASWPCVRTGLKTQSPAQMTTITAGLVHHILSQQHQNPPPPAPTASQTAIARGCYNTAQPSEPGVARANDAIQPEVSIGSHETRKNGAERRGPFLASPGWRVRSIAHAVSLRRGWERSTKAIR